MPRISKIEQARRAEKQVRVEKAKASILEQFGKLLGKHLPALCKPDIEAAGTLQIGIKEGNATLRFQYSTVITDGAFFALDDGQEDLPLNDGPPPQPPAIGRGAKPKPANPPAGEPAEAGAEDTAK